VFTITADDLSASNMNVDVDHSEIGKPIITQSSANIQPRCILGTSNPLRGRVEGAQGEVTVFTITADDLSASNMNGKEEVAIKESTWDGSGSRLANPSSPRVALTSNQGVSLALLIHLGVVSPSYVVEGAQGEVTVFTVTADDLSASNMNGKEEVAIKE
jgi:hypothetical protein